jgi:hypothetical protein
VRSDRSRPSSVIRCRRIIDRISDPAFLTLARSNTTTASHDAAKASPLGDLIGVVQSFVGAPMHTPGLFGEWLQEVYTPVQTHSNFLCCCEPTPTS